MCHGLGASVMVILAVAPHHLAGLQTRLPVSMAVLAGLAALAVVTLQGLWQISQHANTAVHEGAHALVRFGAGQRILIARYSTAGVEIAVTYGIAWFMLLSGIRKVLEHRWNASDAANLRDFTHLPRVLWALLWLVCTVGALAVGGRLLA
jgi:xanthine/uracil/vitamin C permease (AzgA family)